MWTRGKSGITCKVFWLLMQLLQVLYLAREQKRHCIPISWATVKAAWRPSSSITAQLRSGEHMVPTSAIPRVSHEWCPHKSCRGRKGKRKHLKYSFAPTGNDSSELKALCKQQDTADDNSQHQEGNDKVNMSNAMGSSADSLKAQADNLLRSVGNRFHIL